MSIIGIDLGTTHSLVAVFKEGVPTVLQNALGETLTPSVVGLDDQGAVLVGRPAAERLVTHPHLSVANFKRYMGTDKVFKIGAHYFHPEELASFIIRSLKVDAELYLDEKVEEAVISVPAYFNDVQRKATKAAGELAGLKVERLINEPTAAALAYGLHQKGEDQVFLVFDLGGGTFDISVLELFEGIMEVRASGGDNYLGGEDFLEALIQNFLQGINLNKKDLTPHELGRLYRLGEQCKRQLSVQAASKIAMNIKDKEINWEMSRRQFEKMTEELVYRMREPIERVLRDAAVRQNMLRNVVLVGGATKMPLIRSLVSRMFGCLPASSINPEEVVALGAAVQAALKSRDQALNEVVLTDVCPYTLGIAIARQVDGGYETEEFLPIIERNTVIPASRVERVATVSPFQPKVLIKVYQGESRLAKNNIKIDSFEVELTPTSHIQEMDVRFTYDVNGILEVELNMLSTGERKSAVFKTRDGYLSKETISERLKALSEIKIHPREQLKNTVIIAEAEKLYELLLGEKREYLRTELGKFERLLEKQNAKEIEQGRKILQDLIKHLEAID